MKATELQINDWVYLNYWDGKYTQQIHGINYNSWRGEGYSDWVDTEIDDEASIHNIEPIPLTPEILEQNGWKKYATYGTKEDECIEEIYMLHEWSFEVVFSNNEAVSIRHFVSCEDDGYNKLLIEMRDNGYKPMYVHILQHALRICGFDELAVNFKV